MIRNQGIRGPQIKVQKIRFVMFFHKILKIYRDLGYEIEGLFLHIKGRCFDLLAQCRVFNALYGKGNQMNNTSHQSI